MGFTQYELVLFAGGFAITSALLGNWVGHLLTDSRNKKERIVTQYTTFKDSFIPTVQIIKNSNQIPEDSKIFTSYFVVQEATMYPLRSNLKGAALSCFDEKWKEYQEWHKACDTYDHCVSIVAFNGHEIITLIDDMIEIAKKV